MALSTFDTLASGDVGFLLSETGIAVTYRAENDSDNDKSIKAIVEPGFPRAEFDSLNPDTQHYSRIEFWISALDDTDGHQSPKEWINQGQTGDRVQINGVWYYVRDIIEENVAGMHKLEGTTKLVARDA